jgi:hypothetical protein
MKRLLVMMAWVFIAGCTKKSVPLDQSGQLTPIDLSAHPPLVQLPDPEVNGGHVGRAPRRLTVAQLKQSIQVTTGTQWSQIDNLAASLGQADYALTVSDSTEANLVFAKFLEDGAREVCLKVSAADLTRPQAARVLWPEITNAEAGAKGNDFTAVSEASLKANFSALSLRFWGQPMSDQELTTWVTTFKPIAARAKAANKPEQAWGAMCIALMTDSRFVTY